MTTRTVAEVADEGGLHMKVLVIAIMIMLAASGLAYAGPAETAERAAAQYALAASRECQAAVHRSEDAQATFGPQHLYTKNAQARARYWCEEELTRQKKWEAMLPASNAEAEREVEILRAQNACIQHNLLDARHCY